MISLPVSGFTQSHIDLESLSDWIEANALFAESSVSKSDVADVLGEEERVKDDTEGLEIAASAWSTLRERKRIVGDGFALRVMPNRVECASSEWSDFPAQAFCVVVSLSRRYDWWHGEFGSDYTEQGSLFEEVSCSALSSLLSDWSVVPTGWSSGQTSNLEDTVSRVADMLGGGVGEIEDWNHSKAKEMGLDLLAFRDFGDRRQGIPHYFIQCASGKNWDTKLKDPDVNVWNKIVSVATKPRRGFCAPHCFDSREFFRCCVRIDGLFLDRCRLLSSGKINEHWIDSDLAARIVDWLQPRVKRLLETM